MPDTGKGERLVVVDLRQAEPAVLGRDLHAQCAELLETLDDVVRNLGVALDLQRVDLVLEERPQFGEELLALFGRSGGQRRLRVDELKSEVAEEQFLAEARKLPLGLPRGLGDLTGFLFADLLGHWVLLGYGSDAFGVRRVSVIVTR